jgi:hypothetical protein
MVFTFLIIIHWPQDVVELLIFAVSMKQTYKCGRSDSVRTNKTTERMLSHNN